MFRKIVQFKCSTKIYRVILVLHPHGRKTHPRVRATEFCRDKMCMDKFRLAHV